MKKIQFLLDVDCDNNEIEVSMHSSEMPERAFLLGKFPTFTQALLIIQTQYATEISFCDTNSEKENTNDSRNQNSENSKV